MDQENYCPRCAHALEWKETQGKERPVCPSCGKVVYYDPKVTAVAVVERDGNVLFIRRILDPGMGRWSLPGGYVDRGEEVARAAEREVMEETGLEVRVEGVVGVYSQSGHPVILVVYDSVIVGGVLTPGEEASDARFFDLGDLPELAFERDSVVLEDWKSHREKTVKTGSIR